MSIKEKARKMITSNIVLQFEILSIIRLSAKDAKDDDDDAELKC